MNAQIPPETYGGALAGIVDGLVRDTRATIFLGNVPDIRGVPAYAEVDKELLLQQIGAFNDAIASATANRTAARIVRIHGAFSKATGMRGFDRVSGEIAASRGRRFALVNQDGSQTTGNSYALAA